MMPGVRPNSTSRPGRPHSQRGMSEDSPSRVKGLQVSRQEKKWHLHLMRIGVCRTTRFLPSCVLTVTSPCDSKKVILSFRTESRF